MAPHPLCVQEAPERARSARVLELTDCLGFDLPDALARDGKLLADLLQSVIAAHADPEAHPQDPLLARREGLEHPGRGLAQVRLDRGIERPHRILVLDQIGIWDRFLELGGDSLLATRVMSKVMDTFQVAVPLRLFFEASTVAEMAVVIIQHQVAQTDPGTVGRLLDDVEALSEAQLQRILSEKE